MNINLFTFFVVTWVVFQNTKKNIDMSVSQLAAHHNYLFSTSMCLTSFFKIFGERFHILKTASFVFLSLLSIFNVKRYEKIHVVFSYLYFTLSALYCLILNTFFGYACVFLSLSYLCAYIYNLNYRIYLEYCLIVSHILVM